MSTLTRRVSCALLHTMHEGLGPSGARGTMSLLSFPRIVSEFLRLVLRSAEVRPGWAGAREDQDRLSNQHTSTSPQPLALTWGGCLRVRSQGEAKL